VAPPKIVDAESADRSGLDQLMVRSVVASAAGSAARSALRDVMCFAVCFVWLGALLSALGQWEWIAQSRIGPVLATTGEIAGSLIGVGRISLVQAALLHAAFLIFILLPGLIQVISWLALSGVGFSLSAIATAQMVAGSDLFTHGEEGSNRLMFAAILGMLFSFGVGHAAVRSAGAPSPRRAGRISLVLELVGVPRFVLRARHRRIANILQWIGAGILYWGVLGGAVVAVYTQSAVSALGSTALRDVLRREGASALFEVLGLLVGLLVVGLSLKVAARRGFAASSTDLGYKIEQPDLLFLRPFSLDRRRGYLACLPVLSMLVPQRAHVQSIEDAVLAAARRGMFVAAIGEPAGETAAVGAVRAFAAAGARWQDLVVRGIERARAIVLVVDGSPGIAWERDQIVTMGAQGKVALVFQATSDRMEAFRIIRETFGVEARDGDPAERPLLAYATQAGARVLMGKCFNSFEYEVAFSIYFDEGQPCWR
jgi:hypothetical protein